MEEQWIDEVRKKLENHTVTPPPGLWESIEEAMQADKKASPAPQRRRLLRHISLWTASATAAAVLALFVVRNSASPETEPATDGNRLADTRAIGAKHVAPSQSPITPTAPQSDNLLAAATKPAAQSVMTQDGDATSQPAATDSEPQAPVAKTPAEKASETRSEAARPLPEKRPSARHDFGSSLADASLGSADRHSRLSLSVATSNLPSAAKQDRGYGELVYGCIFPVEDPEVGGTEDLDPVEEIVLANQGKETTTRTKHRQPVRFGLSVRYSLNDWLAIESGVTYSYLSSHLSSGTDDYRYETQQTLQFVGVPVKFSCRLWDSKRLEVYATGGGMVEKCVAGKSQTDYVLDGKVASTTNTTTKVRPLQFSVNAAAGIQLKATSRLGVYAEPGVSYYFDNGSPVETIYKEKPLNFNLELGVRYSF